MILYFCHDYNIVRTSNNILICIFQYTSCNYNFINKYFTVLLRHELDGGPEGYIWRVPAEVCANVPDELSVLAASPAGEFHVGAARSTRCLCGYVLVCLDQPVVLDQAQGLRDGRRTEASSVTNEAYSCAELVLHCFTFLHYTSTCRCGSTPLTATYCQLKVKWWIVC